MLDSIPALWPVISGVLGVVGTLGAFAVKERRDRFAERKKAAQDRRDREQAETARFKADFELLRDNYKTEFTRLRDRINELEKMSARDQQLLDAAQQVNRDLTKDLMRLRAEVDVLRSQVERRGVSEASQAHVEQVQ